ncbi:MAG: hypothetical protein ACUVR4_09705 [Anaerolineae bacterium]
MPPHLRQVTSAGAPVRLGLLNGGLIGIALAVGALGPSAWATGGSLMLSWYATLLAGVIIVVLLAGLAGWLAAIAHKVFWALVLWVAAGLGITVVLGHLLYEGSTLVAWFLDRRFWGFPLYVFSPAALARQVMAGFFIVLVLAIGGLLQPYRLEGIVGASAANGRLTGPAWFRLLLPLPLLFGVGLITDNLVYQPLRRAVVLVDQAIRTVRTYEGDLFALSIAREINYNALAGVRDLLSPAYTLRIGEIELGAANTVFVVAHFQEGAWINCRVIADQLSSCWDASAAYLRGLPALLAGQTVKGCPECNVVVDPAAQASLAALSGHFESPPEVRRLAQQGSYVWLRAESAAGDRVADCLLRGITPVRLVECRAVTRGLTAQAPPRRTPVPLTGMALPERGREPPVMVTPDRLAPPPTVFPPTQVDLGAQVYWFRCMVCHGDRGQGLTEEWRSAWDPAHRDCWQSRCHASNHPPEGFQLPYYAPPLIGPGTLARFATLAELHDYLAVQMPWQAPGSLPQEEYWQLVAYLARANGPAVSDADLNTEAAAKVKLARVRSGAGEETDAAVAQLWPWVLGPVLPLGAAILVALIYARRRGKGHL